MRPTEIEVNVTLEAVFRPAEDRCPPPAPSVVGAGLLNSLRTHRRDNGRRVTFHDLRVRSAGLYGGRVEIVDGDLGPQIAFDEIADVLSVTVTAVDPP
jgi:hypothetical protein